jgi:hypothetical protein
LAHAKPVSKAKRRKHRNRIFREVSERLAKGLKVPAAAIEYVQSRSPVKNKVALNADHNPDNNLIEVDLMRAHMRDL